MAVHRPVVFIHSSDEHYGADRVLLDVLAALPPDVAARAEVWLPDDVPHGPRPLCVTLEERGVRCRHLSLPILRRADRTPRGLARLAGRTARTLRALRQRQPETVYCTSSAALVVAPLSRLVGVPRVVGHVQEIWGTADSRVLGLLARACDGLLAISPAAASSLPDRLIERTTIVLNATAEPPTLRPLRGRSGALRFVMAGRWNAWKGHQTLLAAWDLLPHPPELVLLGGPPPSGERTDVVALVAGLRSPTAVRIVGEVPDPGPYLDSSDVVLVPSDNPEPFGLVTIEAFARGRPVIASDAGGASDVISHGEDGWLFPLRDHVALAGLVRSLDRQQVERAADRARSTYESRFTQERYAEEWRRAFSSMPSRR